MPSVPEAVCLCGWVCVYVRESRLASDDKPHRTAITQRNPPRALTPVWPLWPPSVLACGLPCCIHGPAGEQAMGRGAMGSQGTARRGENACFVGGPAVHVSERLCRRRKANLTGQLLRHKKSMYCSARTSSWTGLSGLATSLSRSRMRSHAWESWVAKTAHTDQQGLTDGWADGCSAQFPGLGGAANRDVYRWRHRAARESVEIP